MKRAAIERLRSFEGLDAEDADLGTIAWAQLHHSRGDLDESDVRNFEMRCHWVLADYFEGHDSHARMMREFPPLAKSKQYSRLAVFLSKDGVLAELLHGHGKNDLREYWELIDASFKARAGREEKHAEGHQDSEAKNKEGDAEGKAPEATALPKRLTTTSIEDFLGNIAAVKAKSVRHLEADEMTSAMAQTAERLGNIATLLEMLGKFDKTIEIRKEEITFLELSLGKKHESVGIVCSRLGKTFEVMYGNYERALEMKQRALEIDVDVLGDSDPKLAVSYDNLAMLELKMRNYSKADELFLKSLQLPK